MSRTNHPRIKGTHQVGHADRDWKRENARPGWSVFGETATNLRQAAKADIEVGLEQLAAEVDVDERYTERKCMSEWEALDEWSVVDGPERMAEWEVTLLTLRGFEPAEDAAWATSTSPVPTLGEWVDAMPEDDLDDDTEATDWSPWLTGSVEEAFPDRCYVVEGPAPRESVRAPGYYRVYEAARLLDVDTSTLITLLRAEGEWVAGAGAYVAKPVIDEWVGAPALKQYQPRTKRTWSEVVADARAALRQSDYRLVGAR